MTQKDKLEAKERIIKAVLKIIGQKGAVKFTVREIAKVADVNLSAVNYYFRSTRNLLNEVEIYFAEKVQGISKILSEDNSDPRNALISWSKAMMELLSKNTGILWIIANKIIQKGNPGIFIEKLFEGNNSILKKLISELTNNANDQFITFKIMQLISDISFPVIMCNGLGKNLGQDFNDPSVIEKYSNMVVNNILP
jgi:AcrR family transcriptional regulator